MTFEYDQNKSSANLVKHGIDFDEAQELWLDVWRLERPVSTLTELRFQVIAKYEEKIWSAFITYRGKNIRIVSVRHARTEEKEKYDER